MMKWDIYYEIIFLMEKHCVLTFETWKNINTDEHMLVYFFFSVQIWICKVIFESNQIFETKSSGRNEPLI